MTLRRALQEAPDAADAREALGLTLVRQRRMPEAMAELAKAAQLQPDVPHYAYVYAVALHDSGDTQRALAVLQQVHERAPADRAIVGALADYEAQAGNPAGAQAWTRVLADMAAGVAQPPGRGDRPPDSRGEEGSAHP